VHFQAGVNSDETFDTSLVIVLKIQASTYADLEYLPMSKRHNLSPLAPDSPQAAGQVHEIRQQVPVVPTPA